VNYEKLADTLQAKVNALTEIQQLHFYKVTSHMLTRAIQDELREGPGTDHDRNRRALGYVQLLSHTLGKLDRAQTRKPWPKSQLQLHMGHNFTDHETLVIAFEQIEQDCPEILPWMSRAVDISASYAATFFDDTGQTKNRFLRCLGETIAWCGPRCNIARPDKCLRSTDFFGRLDLTQDCFEFSVDRFQVSRLTAVRSQLIRGEGASVRAIDPHRVGGRLLVHYCECANHHGMSKEASSGFFDEWELPPWDTWIDVVQTDDSDLELLVAWIPPAFEQLAQRGIDADFMEILMWADAPKWTHVPENSMPLWLRELAAKFTKGLRPS